jgi:hypothetical protein
MENIKASCEQSDRVIVPLKNDKLVFAQVVNTMYRKSLFALNST